MKYHSTIMHSHSTLYDWVALKESICMDLTEKEEQYLPVNI